MPADQGRRFDDAEGRLLLEKSGPQDQGHTSGIRQPTRPELMLLIKGQLLAEEQISATKDVRDETVASSPAKPAIRFTVDDKGGIEAAADFSELVPGTAIDGYFSQEGKKVIFPHATVMADNTGSAKLSLRWSGDSPTKGATLLNVCVRPSGSAACQSSYTVDLSTAVLR